MLNLLFVMLLIRLWLESWRWAAYFSQRCWWPNGL